MSDGLRISKRLVWIRFKRPIERQALVSSQNNSKNQKQILTTPSKPGGPSRLVEWHTIIFINNSQNWTQSILTTSSKLTFTIIFLKRNCTNLVQNPAIIIIIRDLSNINVTVFIVWDDVVKRGKKTFNRYEVSANWIELL